MMNNQTESNLGAEGIDFDSLRAQLSEKSGQEYWRSLEEVSNTPEFQRWVEDEFPNRRTLADLDRRDFLKFMGASLMFAGLAGCRAVRLPTEQVAPYAFMPEDSVAGQPLQFASAFAHNGTAIGVLVKSYDGRPGKIEGNPNHPQSLGATDAITQAAILDFYDPERARDVAKGTAPSSWEVFLRESRAALEFQARTKGAGLRVLTDGITSLTTAAQLAEMQAKFPLMRVTQYCASGPENELEAARSLFGKPALPVYNLGSAKVVLSLDGDFLGSMPESVRMSGEFMSGRKINGKDVAEYNRLYSIESSPTITGAAADHRKAVKTSVVEAYARKIAVAMGIPAPISSGGTIDGAFVSAIAQDLRNGGVVVAGPEASVATHMLAYAINARIGAVGKFVTYHNPVVSSGVSQLEGLRNLVDELTAGQVEVLLILGGNPAYDAPANMLMAEAIKKAAFSAHLTTVFNETSDAVQYKLPASHFIESWSDAVSRSGDVSVVQPLIAPLYSSKSVHEFLGSLMGNTGESMRTVAKALGADAESDAWKMWLNSGVAMVKRPAAAVTAAAGWLGNLPEPQPIHEMEIAFRLDPTVFDGRYANNGWLQELPKPLTSLTWDNAALISPATAEALGVKRSGNHVEIKANGQSITIPALITVGHPDGSVTLHMGYGRTRGGSVTEGTGTNVFPLRHSKSATYDKAEVASVAGFTALALCQTHHSMEGRPLIKDWTLAEFGEDAERKTHEEHLDEKNLSMYPEKVEQLPSPQWGMTIDLSLCTGCNACVTACQAENNIPVVGKKQVLEGREMHWIRIDRYYRVNTSQGAKDVEDQLKGRKEDVLNPDHVQTLFQPLACMHCEIAPCEPVCPVAATVHSAEGLNQMVYNRCVGTRYCSNNCPYKVRRFNFLNYTDNQPNFMDRTEMLHTMTSSEKVDGRSLLKMFNSPDVTVRGRGVMEKCTYCVQRINAARITAKKDGREISDGEVRTACQQVCPTSAITFGNVADKASSVSQKKTEPREFSVLPELNTRNRTTYLARLRNPNEELSKN